MLNYRGEDKFDNDELSVHCRRLPFIVLEVRLGADREQDAVVIQRARKHLHRQTEMFVHVPLTFIVSFTHTQLGHSVS